MGECFFWYRPTWVVPDQRPLNGRRCCCCNLFHHIPHALADGNQRIQIKEKMLEFSTVLSTLSPYDLFHHIALIVYFIILDFHTNWHYVLQVATFWLQMMLRSTQGCSGAETRGDASASPHFFRQGARVPHSTHFFGLKFVQKLVHCCNWLLTEKQCKIISVQQH